MKEILSFLTQYGYLMLAGVVAAEQLGAPIPAVPVLLAVGALAGSGHFSVPVAIALGACASVIADVIWYEIGRRKGHSVLRWLCRISLEPDSCVSSTRIWFRRAGAWALLFAKFIPGFSTVAPPLAGVSRMPLWKFTIADAAGAVLWVGTFVMLGFVFHSQIEMIGTLAGRLGGWLVVGLAGALALYVIFKWWQRKRFIRNLLVARVSPEDLKDRLDDVVVLDLRSEFEVREQGYRLPGAMWFDRRALDEKQLEIPRDKDVIVYCS